MGELWRISAVEAVRRLKRREVSPLELIDAAAARIEATNPKINALVTLCYERAREHARRIMSEKRQERAAALPVRAADRGEGWHRRRGRALHFRLAHLR